MTELLLGVAILGFLVWLLITYVPMPDPLKMAVVVIAVIYVVIRVLPRLGIVLPVLLAALLVTTGCVTPLARYSDMSPEQIKELVRDKTMAGGCLVANTPYGRGVTTFVAIDKSVVEKGGTFSVDSECKMTFQQGSSLPR